MSQWRGRIEDIEEPGDVLDVLEEYYHLPALLLLVVFMLWSRVRHWKRFVVDGTVYFSGNDPWYHYRMTKWTVRHWPETSPFDPWTYFPYGAHSSQFGTLFDQLMATAALVVGLGNPSDQTIRLVVLFAPAVFGTVAAIPVYVMGKHLSNRFGGVIAVMVLALAGSDFVSRGTVGFADHQIAEALFQVTAVLATMIAISVAQREKPVWELVEARDVAAIRRPLGWAVVAGTATALYMWTWPPGVFLVGILGVYYLLELSSLQVHGESPEPVAFVGAVSMLTTTVLMFAVLEGIDVSSTSFNLIQPGLALLVAFGCVFMAWLSREWEARDVSDYLYPATVVGIIAVGAGLTAVLLPDIFSFFVDQVLRVVGLSVSETAATIGEAQPLPFEQLFPRYGFTLVVALLGVGYVAGKQFLTKPRSELLLLAVWTVFMLFATLTQRRFDYYFALTVAVMTGLVVARLASFGNLFERTDDIQTYQVLSVVAIFVVLFAPLVYPQVLAMQNSAARPGPSVQAWNESLSWMDSNTPEEGNLGGAGNDIPLYGTFERTENYDYQPGFYGVLSWWDYGHWITVMGDRIPTANPFQQGADQAANFLLSTSESQALDVLSDLKDGNGTETRYVMVDWKMATSERLFRTQSRTLNLNGKYFAPFQFYSAGDISQRNFYQSLLYPTGQRGGTQYRTFSRHKQPYYNSTVVRLYKFHGSAVNPQPVVLDWEIRDVNGQQLPVSTGVKRYDNMSAARKKVENDPTSQIGGVGKYPVERVPAMEHFRLVGTSTSSAVGGSYRYYLALRKVARGAFQQPLRKRTGGINYGVLGKLHKTSPQWVKQFEHVPGATIQGEGPANATVRAAVQMEVPASNTTFVYRQQAETGPDGEFTMTVPYSTTGYENWGPEEGYTNVTVRATGPYQFRAGGTVNESGYAFQWTGTTNVTEAQVLGEADTQPTVTLERQQIGSPANETTGNATAGNATAGNAT
ncbi:MAG: oligosaccharyl transferase, archaeosortase A system-associated, partial [Haloarculaceae archaeon]